MANSKCAARRNPQDGGLTTDIPDPTAFSELSDDDARERHEVHKHVACSGPHRTPTPGPPHPCCFPVGGVRAPNLMPYPGPRATPLVGVRRREGGSDMKLAAKRWERRRERGVSACACCSVYDDGTRGPIRSPISRSNGIRLRSFLSFGLVRVRRAKFPRKPQNGSCTAARSQPTRITSWGRRATRRTRMPNDWRCECLENMIRVSCCQTTPHRKDET